MISSKSSDADLSFLSYLDNTSCGRTLDIVCGKFSQGWDDEFIKTTDFDKFTDFYNTEFYREVFLLDEDNTIAEFITKCKERIMDCPEDVSPSNLSLEDVFMRFKELINNHKFISLELVIAGELSHCFVLYVKDMQYYIIDSYFPIRKAETRVFDIESFYSYLKHPYKDVSVSVWNKLFKCEEIYLPPPYLLCPLEVYLSYV